MDDQASRNAGAVGMAARRVEADIINLGAKGQVWKKRKIHAATEAIGELVAGTAATTNGDAGASQKALHKGRKMGRIAQRNPRTEEVRVRVHGNTGRRSVVAANIRNQTKPPVGVIGHRAADSVLVESA